MELDTQKFLTMAEETSQLAFFDIETNNLKADYGSIVCASIKPYGKKAYSFAVEVPGRDKTVVRDLRDALQQYAVICGYYSKGFDMPFLRSRLLRYDMNDVLTPLHLDMYFTLKPKILTSRKSQAHLLAWMGTIQQKMTVSADVWSQVASNPRKAIPSLIRRCESDVAGLEALYDKTRHLIKEISH